MGVQRRHRLHIVGGQALRLYDSCPAPQIEAEFAKFEDPAEPGCMNGDQVLAFAEKLGVDPFRCGYREVGTLCICRPRSVKTVSSWLGPVRGSAPHLWVLPPFSFSSALMESAKSNS